MVTIERLAYSSKLNRVNPAIKGIVALSSLLVCLFVDQYIFSLLVWSVMAYGCIGLSGLSSREYVRLCMIPVCFLFIAVLTIAIRFSWEPIGLVNIPFFAGYYLMITEQGLALGANIWLTSMACVSCLYFLYVTTPINDLIGLLRKVKLPEIFIEMMLLIYRLIFILLHMISEMNLSRKSRLGNISRKASFRSGTIVASSVFIKGLKHSMDMASAMESRGYDGTMVYWEEEKVASRKQMICFIGYEIILLLAAIWMYCW